ncbi:helix-turn-helix domain-containing protein [Rhodobacter sp. NSM]|uniref:helix-turn-helix domain-containing protein n=1 Tax=Rhodobacter sp. NSM TaxID=3457501 RepID=UPI003FD47B04
MPASDTQIHLARIEQALAADAAARSALVASWSRSANVHGLDPARHSRHERLTATEFRMARERLEGLLRVAGPTLDRLFHLVSGMGACVLLADRDGIPLDRRGRAADDRDFEDCGLWTGTVWSEARAGTNGIGTCLAEERAVTIHRDQHFFSAHIALSCTSAPIHDAEGSLAAVIDVSSTRSEVTRDVAALIGRSVTDAARQIETDLFHARFPNERMVLVPGADRTSQRAILAVDADELVVGATRAARLHFGLRGDLARAPVPAADLLGILAHESPDAAERAVLNRALARAGGNVSAAARSLGLSRATLHRRLGRRN